MTKAQALEQILYTDSFAQTESVCTFKRAEPVLIIMLKYIS